MRRTIKEHLSHLSIGHEITVTGKIMSINKCKRGWKEFLEVRLEDTSGYIDVLVWLPYEAQDLLKKFHTVHIVGVYQTINHSNYLVAKDISSAYDSVYTIRSIPFSKAPSHENLESFRRITETFIMNKHLKIFINQIFNDYEVWGHYITVPASWTHHHSYDGGLLEHSVEVAERCHLASLDLSSDMRDLLTVAALLHDIGKIRTHNKSNSKTVRRLVQHELITMEILAKPLKDLDKVWAMGANAMRYLLTQKQSNSVGFPLLPEVEILKMADRMSAAISARDSIKGEGYEKGSIVSVHYGSGPINRFWLYE